MIWSIDGLQWDIGCTVERSAEMTASEISGLMLDKSYFNDVIGTYMRYDIRLAVPKNMLSQYALLYEKITEPVSQHEFVLPYGSGNITIVGRVENLKDVYVRMPQGKPHWKGITFSIIANHPTKELTLEEAIVTRGVPPLPPESAVNVGACYQYTTNGWEEMADAEDYYY